MPNFLSIRGDEISRAGNPSDGKLAPTNCIGFTVRTGGKNINFDSSERAGIGSCRAASCDTPGPRGK